MGLGKTAQVISFIAHLLASGQDATHLVIVPSSTLSNWVREFERWCPSISVVSYIGSIETRRETRDLIESGYEYYVVVTTYNIATGSKEDRRFLKHLYCDTMILDEGF
jgi:SWI/SNF-related matrix-associated actin-dependent regulator 1 of chromatin subfamily A